MKQVFQFWHQVLSQKFHHCSIQEFSNTKERKSEDGNAAPKISAKKTRSSLPHRKTNKQQMRFHCIQSKSSIRKNLAFRTRWIFAFQVTRVVKFVELFIILRHFFQVALALAHSLLRVCFLLLCRLFMEECML